MLQKRDKLSFIEDTADLRFDKLSFIWRRGWFRVWWPWNRWKSVRKSCLFAACLLACLVLLLQFLVAGLCFARCDGSCIQGLRSWSCCWCCNCGYWTSFWYCQGRQQNNLCLFCFFFLLCCSLSSSGNAFFFFLLEISLSSHCPLLFCCNLAW